MSFFVMFHFLLFHYKFYNYLQLPKIFKYNIIIKREIYLFKYIKQFPTQIINQEHCERKFIENSSTIINSNKNTHKYNNSNPNISINNKSSKLSSNNNFINVYGVYYESMEKDEYYQSISLDKTKFNIMLCHDPKYFDTFANMGFDLVLSGHVQCSSPKK